MRKSAGLGGGANICSIALRVRQALVVVSIATSAHDRLWPCFTGRSSLTLCASPSGRPPIASDVAAGSSLPHTV